MDLMYGVWISLMGCGTYGVWIVVAGPASTHSTLFFLCTSFCAAKCTPMDILCLATCLHPHVPRQKLKLHRCAQEGLHLYSPPAESRAADVLLNHKWKQRHISCGCFCRGSEGTPYLFIYRAAHAFQIHLTPSPLPCPSRPLTPLASPPAGNALGMVGVATGVGAALASLHVPLPVYAQVNGRTVGREGWWRQEGRGASGAT